MSSAHVLSPQESSLDLLWVGDGAWVACDTRLDQNDPRRVIAYLECKDHQVYVLWVRIPQEVTCYATLREALQAVTSAADDAAELQPRGR